MENDLSQPIQEVDTKQERLETAQPDDAIKSLAGLETLYESLSGLENLAKPMMVEPETDHGASFAGLESLASPPPPTTPGSGQSQQDGPVEDSGAQSDE